MSEISSLQRQDQFRSTMQDLPGGDMLPPEPSPVPPVPQLPLTPNPDLNPAPDAAVSPILDEDPIRPRIPHLGHALLFVGITFFLLILAQVLVLAVTHSLHDARRLMIVVRDPKFQLSVMALTYSGTLVASWFVFPQLWHRPFIDGLNWNAANARRLLLRLIPLGILTALISQALSSLISMPKTLPMDDFFRTPMDVWIITLFGVLLGPLFEEVCFRGFLLPAFAIAYDWLSLKRTPQAARHWSTTNSLTLPALIFSGIVTSILFALMHAKQLGHLWAALIILIGVSLVLTTVRIRTQSVAASTLVHATYNFTVFATLFFATGGYRHLERMTR